MRKPSSETAVKLDALRREYVSQLGERFDKIDALWHCVRDEPGNIATIEALFVEIHRLSGSGATFGFEALSRASVAIERMIKPWLTLDDSLPLPEQECVGKLIAGLRQCMSRNTPGDAGCEQVFAGDRRGGRPLAYIVGSDPAVAADIGVQLSHFDYDVEAFFDAKTAFEAIVRQRPQVLLVDAAIGGVELAGTALLEALGNEVDLADVQLYVMSCRNDIDVGSAAARCGAEVFSLKPVDVSRVVDRLNTAGR